MLVALTACSIASAQTGNKAGNTNSSTGKTGTVMHDNRDGQADVSGAADQSIPDQKGKNSSMTSGSSKSTKAKHHKSGKTKSGNGSMNGNSTMSSDPNSTGTGASTSGATVPGGSGK